MKIFHLRINFFVLVHRPLRAPDVVAAPSVHKLKRLLQVLPHPLQKKSTSSPVVVAGKSRTSFSISVSCGQRLYEMNCASFIVPTIESAYFRNTSCHKICFEGEYFSLLNRIMLAHPTRQLNHFCVRIRRSITPVLMVKIATDGTFSRSDSQK